MTRPTLRRAPRPDAPHPLRHLAEAVHDAFLLRHDGDARGLLVLVLLAYFARRTVVWHRCLALDSESRSGMLPRTEVPFLDRRWHRYKFVASRVLFTVPLVGPNRSGLPSPQIEIERR